MTDLYWLPIDPDWSKSLKALDDVSDEPVWPGLVRLAQQRCDLARTERLARALTRLCPQAPSAGLAAPPQRLALLSSCTVDHLVSGLRIAGLRRSLWVDVHIPPYDQYAQELADGGSGLHRFQPTVIAFALDARRLVRGLEPDASHQEAQAVVDRSLDQLRRAWDQARKLAGTVLHQTPLPIFPPLMGANEHRLPGSPERALRLVSERLPALADEHGVDLVAVAETAARDGMAAWHDDAGWNRAKQDIHPAAAPLWGDLVMRVLAARLGRSCKALVLDLDNTLWGGVIGDDGLGGILIGQGGAQGEAHLALQSYAKGLAARGVILAVCSKNDEAVALEPFEKHPDMLLRRGDFAAFVANWNDKASGLREIARRLNIGLDALAFVDDNPFERNIVRRELPMVVVPELPEDPAGYVRCLADSGAFEAVSFTAEDAARSGQYQANLERERAKEEVTDLQAYLESMNMELRWRPFDAQGLARVVQLINKTNQFNLTTRRYTASEAEAVMADPKSVALQLRLVDAFGDNGVIAVIIARPAAGDGDLEIDTWLMSCRVLGRRVEQASLNLLAQQAIAIGARRLIGVYRATERNGMVADHYTQLGFEPERGGEDARFVLTLDAYTPLPAPIATIKEGS
jgi:FkbH-like protein